MPLDNDSDSKKSALQRLKMLISDDSPVKSISISKVDEEGEVEPNFEAGQLLRKLLERGE